MAECFETVSRSSDTAITNCFCRSESEPVPVPCIGASVDTLPVNGLDDSSAECACNKMSEPQCDSSGVQLASNSCIRDCLGYPKGQVNMWYCGEITVCALPHSLLLLLLRPARQSYREGEEGVGWGGGGCGRLEQCVRA